MAKSFSELQTLAIQIRDELNKKKNSAQRVGSALLDIIDNCIQNITDIKQKLSVFEHACSGFKRVSSEAQLPVTPSQEDLAKGFLVNTSLYLYVGTGGNAVNGRYFNVGDIRGPQGEPGSKGETGNTGPTGEKGEQGNSGVTGDTSDIVVINNLDGGESEEGSIKVLAAEQGKVLNKKFTELNQYSNTPYLFHGSLNGITGIYIENKKLKRTPILRTDKFISVTYPKGYTNGQTVYYNELNKPSEYILNDINDGVTTINSSYKYFVIVVKKDEGDGDITDNIELSFLERTIEPLTQYKDNTSNIYQSTNTQLVTGWINTDKGDLTETNDNNWVSTNFLDAGKDYVVYLKGREGMNFVSYYDSKGNYLKSISIPCITKDELKNTIIKGRQDASFVRFSGESTILGNYNPIISQVNIGIFS